MAHSNIDARRESVKALLDKGVQKKEILKSQSIKFNCHVSAIYADLNHFQKLAESKAYRHNIEFRNQSRKKNTENKRKGHTIPLNTFLKTPIQQYLNFFEDFVKASKGQNVGLKVEKIEEGLYLEFSSDQIDEMTIKVWLEEYMEFIKQKIGEFQVVFEFEATDTQADILITRLENQVVHLQSSLKIVQLELEFTKRENILLIEQRDLMKEIIDIKMIPTHSQSKNDTILYLKELIAKGYTEKAIEVLKSKVANEEYNKLTVISAKYYEAKNKCNLGVLSETNKSIFHQQVNVALVDIIDRL
jgi:hypothetical protein